MRYVPRLIGTRKAAAPAVDVAACAVERQAAPSHVSSTTTRAVAVTAGAEERSRAERLAFRRSTEPVSLIVAAAVAGCVPLARATAAPASSTPQPSSGVHVPWLLAVVFRICATDAASSSGFAAQTRAAAPATSGDENDVPLAKPYSPDAPGSATRGKRSGEDDELTTEKTFSPGATSET